MHSFKWVPCVTTLNTLYGTQKLSRVVSTLMKLAGVGWMGGELCKPTNECESVQEEGLLPHDIQRMKRNRSSRRG